MCVCVFGGDIILYVVTFSVLCFGSRIILRVIVDMRFIWLSKKNEVNRK